MEQFGVTSTTVTLLELQVAVEIVRNVPERNAPRTVMEVRTVSPLRTAVFTSSLCVA